MKHLLIDAASMFRNVNKFFPNRKLNYTLLVEKLKSIYGDDWDITVYVSQSIQTAHRFITALKGMGFETKFREPRTFMVGDNEIKRPAFNVEITVDAMKKFYEGQKAFVEKADPFPMFFIASTDTDFIPLYKFFREIGTKIAVIGNSLPMSITNCINESCGIDESLLTEEIHAEVA